MVLGLLALATTVPFLATPTINLQDSAQKHQQQGEHGSAVGSGDASDDLNWKTEICHLKVRYTERMNGARKKALDGCSIVLRDGCLFASS